MRQNRESEYLNYDIPHIPDHCRGGAVTVIVFPVAHVVDAFFFAIVCSLRCIREETG